MGKKPNAANAAPKAAEPKSKAKAKAEPKPEQPPVEVAPKAKAKEEPPKAKAKAKAKEEPPPAEVPAPKPQANVAAVEPKAKAKKKKAEPAPPPPEPEEDDDDDDEEEEQATKKKKNRRGGTKKKGDGEGGAATNSGPTKEQLAEAEAEKDVDYIKIRDRLGKTDAKSFDGNKLEELENIIKEIHRVMKEKKGALTTGAGVVGSDFLAAELQKLKSAKPNDPNVAEFQKQLEEAKAKERFEALKPKMTALRIRAEEKRDVLSPGKKVVETSNDQQVESSDRQKYAFGRLRNMEKEVNDDDILAHKVVELPVDLMKACFTPPGNLLGTFERKYGVVIDKGSNKGKGGGKGVAAPLPKEVTLWAPSRGEVDFAAAELKKIDFSGSTTMKVPEKLNLMREKLDEQFDVILSKRGEEVYIFGSKGNVTKTIAKIEEIMKSEGRECTETIELSEALVRSVTDKIYEWKKKFKVDDLRMVDREKNPKMIVRGKSEKEVEAARDAIKDFLKSMASELCSATEEQLAKLFKTGSSLSDNPYRNVTRQFADLRNMHGNNMYIQRKDNGVQVVGAKKLVEEVKKKVNEMLKKVNHEPFMYELGHEQATKIFMRDRGALVDEMMKKSGAELAVDATSERMVIIGSNEQVEKAKEAIKATLAEQGTVKIITLNGEAGYGAMKANQAEKIKQIEVQYKNVVLNMSKNTSGGGEITLIGPEATVVKAEKDVRAFVEAAEQREKDSVEETVTVDEAGCGAVRFRQIRDTIPNLQIWYPEREVWHVIKVKGLPDDVEKAKEMIDDMMNYRMKETVAPKPNAKENAPQKPRKPQEYKPGNDDFPDLVTQGSGGKKQKKLAGQWGKKAEESANQTAKPQEAKEQFPTLGKKAAAPAKEEPKATEVEAVEEEACDFDDPLAMMSGMGAETFGEVTAFEEAKEED